MAVFIDTGIFVALRNADDENHEKSKDLVRRVLKGEYGRIYTSDYIMDEAVATALARPKRHDVALDVGRYVIESPESQGYGSQEKPSMTHEKPSKPSKITQ